MATPVNIKFPLRRSPKGAFATNDTTIEAISDDIKILLLTNHGERPIHFDFGANLRSVLFEPASIAVRKKAEDSIITALEKWMPFVNLIEIRVEDETVNSNLRPNEFKVFLRFEVGQVEGTLEQTVRN